MKTVLQLLAIASLLLSPSLGAGAPRWVRVQGAGVEVCSNAGEKPARNALAQFEKARLIFRRLPFGVRAAPLPVRIYLFANERDFAPYRRGEATEAYFQSGPEWDFIAVRHNSSAGARVILHEYTHLALSHTSPRLPKWLAEGLAEFYSAVVQHDGQLRLGSPLEAHLRVLRTTRWLSPATLSQVNEKSPEYNEKSRVGVFYAQSWALVHMLYTSPEWRDGFAAFFDLLNAGAAQSYAFRDAFRRPFEMAVADLPRHLRQERWPALTLPPESVPETADAARAEPIEDLEAQLLLADLAFQTGRFAPAEGVYRRLAEKRPDSPQAATRLGALALRFGRKEEARQHLSRAIAMGSREAETYFEYAVLLRGEGGDRDDVVRNLERAAELNPNFAEAHFLLGNAEMAGDRPREAIGHFLRATAILPRQAYFWHALALAYHQLGQRDEALRAAFRARDAALTDRETEMAEAAIRLASTPVPASPQPARPAVTTPKSWENPKSDRRAEGTLRYIDCLGRAARFHVETGGKLLKLYVSNPGEVLLANASSVTFEFRCGEQKPLPLVVEYKSAPDAATGTVGVLTSIEFR